jgi:epoxyqueuosine reductase
VQQPAHKEQLRTDLLALGFDSVRFARVDGTAPGAAALDAWLSAGMQAGMEWMARNGEKRKQPRLVLEGTLTLIMLGVNYGSPTSDEPGKEASFARYARYEDYHDTIKPALEAAGRLLETHLGLGAKDYRYYVDSGPVLERSWAAQAGMGFVGKNAMLISRDFGNWLFLSAILVRAEIEPDAPLRSSQEGPGALCGKCTRCLDQCPTRAIKAPGVVDARLCISYLTIENKGAIPEELRSAIGTRVYGCDLCAEVCPWNRFARESHSLLLRRRKEIGTLELAELLILTPETFAERFRKTPIKRVKLAGLLRNACVAAGNSGDASLLPLLDALLTHESELVREHARWAGDKLRGGRAEIQGARS